MYKPLSEIDSIYKKTISKLPKKERLDYCENLIDKAQFNLIRNKRKIDQTLEDQLYQIVLAAQKEISKINEEEDETFEEFSRRN